jgi:hypothetical protein
MVRSDANDDDANAILDTFATIPDETPRRTARGRAAFA